MKDVVNFHFPLLRQTYKEYEVHTIFRDIMGTAQGGRGWGFRGVTWTPLSLPLAVF